MISRPEASVLVVDDDEAFRTTLIRSLERGGYTNITSASSGEEACRFLTAGSFDLILTDMQMPGTSGMDLLTTAQELCPDAATMMVTGRDDPELAESALELGAYGYIVKPFKRNEVLIGVANALRRRDLEIENARRRDSLEDSVRRRTSTLWDAVRKMESTQKDLELSQEETVHRLSRAAEFRDDETSNHIERMSRYCAVLAERSGADAMRCQVIRLAAKMHDIGKIGIPDSVLLKPGKLTAHEFEIMKSHAEIGYQILKGSQSELGRLGASIARTHHEKFDGSGYPHGLGGDEIPFEGRLAAVADVFDALTTDRVYRKAFPFTEALNVMRAGRGSHFDPELLDGFFEMIPRILATKETIRLSHAA